MIIFLETIKPKEIHIKANIERWLLLGEESTWLVELSIYKNSIQKGGFSELGIWYLQGSGKGRLGEMIAKSMTPASVLKVDVNEETQEAKVYILPSERAKAIWKNGININLASQLLGYTISLIEIEW